MKEELSRVLEDNDKIFFPFSHGELLAGLKHLKSGKASGLNGISAEMIKQFGDKALDWLLELFNNCTNGIHLPKMWQCAKIVALPKPSERSKDAKKLPTNVTPLHTLYKLYE